MRKLILFGCAWSLLSVPMGLQAQEFWSGVKNTTSSISRSGDISVGYARLRNNATINAAVFEHVSEEGDFYIRARAAAADLQGNLILNDNGGNVGIGTNNPQAKLAVNGNILAKEVKVKTDITVPDYVFEPDYELPALADIEAYAKEHKHLPEIPSAADIARDGLDLAEMNLLLLKKVEELTLHLIEHEKKYRGLRSYIQLMENQLLNAIEHREIN